MALIEIRDPEGNRLAASDDLSEAIGQLVTKCCGYRDTVTRLTSRVLAGNLPPDTSATAPEHVAVYSAGWNNAIRRVRDVMSDAFERFEP